MREAVRVLIEGRVQGVGFRYFAQDAAMQLRLTGWVRNLPNGAVEAYAEGRRSDLETWVAHIRQGPPLSRVEAVDASWQIPQGTAPTFTVR